MADLPSGLVWLASYPKSGNTWMRVLLANLLAGNAQPVDINNLSEPDTLVGRWRFADEMLVDPDLLDWSELERMRPLLCDFAAADRRRPVFCKTHNRFWTPEGNATLGTAARSALYIVRDPRDVAVSLSHHASLSVDAAIASMSDPHFCAGGGALLPYLLGEWAGHVAGWTGQSLVRTKVVAYEDMHRDTAGTLTDIVDFLGGRATETEIRRTVLHSGFDELQRQESSKGFKESRPGQRRFFRSGRVGEWREVLTVAQARAIENRFADVMGAHGYAPEA